MVCDISRKDVGALGFALQPGSGQSEYLTIYGGLQLGLGLMFLWPAIRAADTRTMLICCVLLHASLALFRSLSLLRYSGFSTMTFAVTAVEWLIAIASVSLLLRRSTSEDSVCRRVCGLMG